MDAQPKETDFCGPSLPPRFSVQSDHGSQHFDPESDYSDPQFNHSERPKRVRSSQTKNMRTKRNIKWAKYSSQSSSSEEDSILVKHTQERSLKFQDLILQLKSKHVLTARCLMWLIGLLASTEKNGPGGMTSHEALSVSPQGALETSPVIGQPPSLDINHLSIPRLVAESHKRDERWRSSYERPQYPTLYRCLKRRLGLSLRASLYQRSVVRQRKKATHKRAGAEGGFSDPSKFQGPVAKPNSVGCYGQLNSSGLHREMHVELKRVPPCFLSVFQLRG